MQNADATQEHSDTANEPATTDITPQDLTLFQQEILLVLARDGPTYGLGIKRQLEELYGEEINHGRLYPNLDDLVEFGLIAKSERDRRTNNYELSSDGRFLVRNEAERRNAIVQTLKPGANSRTEAENGGEK